jgi:hypothetical protein
MTNSVQTKSSPIEVRLSQPNISVACSIVFDDEKTEQLVEPIDSHSARCLRPAADPWTVYYQTLIAEELHAELGDD